MKPERTLILGGAALLAVLGTGVYHLMSDGPPTVAGRPRQDVQAPGRAEAALTATVGSVSGAAIESASRADAPGTATAAPTEPARSRFAAVPATGPDPFSSSLTTTAMPEQTSALSAAKNAAPAQPRETGKERGAQRRGPGYAPGPINMPPALRAALSQSAAELSATQNAGSVTTPGRSAEKASTAESAPDTTVAQVGNLMPPPVVPTTEAPQAEGSEAAPRRRQGRAVPTVEMQRWRAQLGWEAFQEWSVDQARKTQER